jgi:hypothetical protein
VIVLVKELETRNNHMVKVIVEGLLWELWTHPAN